MAGCSATLVKTTRKFVALISRVDIGGYEQELTKVKATGVHDDIDNACITAGLLRNLPIKNNLSTCIEHNSI